MRPVPYIGITGFTTNEQVQRVVRAAEIPRFYPYLMIGVLVSENTLAGHPAKWPKRNPAKEKIASIFEPFATTINLVHYHTTDQSTLVGQLVAMDTLAGDHCDGYQLNMPWPDPRLLEQYLSQAIARNKKRTIVLQCGRRALEKFGKNPRRIAEEVRTNYEGLVDYVLIDPSGGKGEEIDSHFAVDCLNELMQIRNIGPGIAGGLSYESGYAKLAPIAQDIDENFSVDAEGRMRDSNDDLDIDKCIGYVSEMSKFFAH